MKKKRRTTFSFASPFLSFAFTAHSLNTLSSSLQFSRRARFMDWFLSLETGPSFPAFRPLALQGRASFLRSAGVRIAGIYANASSSSLPLRRCLVVQVYLGVILKIVAVPKSDIIYVRGGCRGFKCRITVDVVGFR